MSKELHARLGWLGRLMHATRAIRIYRNGDGVGFVWRWWNPLSWCLAPALGLIAVVLYGAVPSWQEREDLGYRVDPYFNRNGIDPFDCPTPTKRKDAT